MEIFVKRCVEVLLALLTFIGIFIALNIASFSIVGGFIIIALFGIGSTIYSCLTKNE